ncbi:MAG: chromosome partitioning protein ParB [Cupriavidus sp.]|uniref:PRTRC system ParB family protein n=1 Tax=Cupriavidus TaxID=106589 RepID=UPI0004BA45AC|nr:MULTISPECIES: PRTRC system ParB family protein [Cupriavidus]MBU66298.1 chromosome partitioning protein ParB [Cupriavidus sp.]MCA3185617.1 PRTRC system ParB family protein [Cupriavidus sp.]MCA3193920.1 PRTRC system ParB family protein [Cupriavidus sp.]MCA3198349.1 PRTRC system ParB family protein [Cupriavidus sp.]MCA3231237.1 PRTRC system ParB family protein [Cupriavidus sp.]
MQNPTVVIGKIRPGCNPRKYFDPAEMAELTESIRVDGVIQPILIRPVEDEEHGHEYEVVAGERRYRAALAAHGDGYEMPVNIKVLTDAEARRYALIENVQRADMAPSEEAASAAEIVGQLKGDRDEAARQLGWSRSTLDKRLALMNCSESVLEALNTRTIQLGHAELLATLAKDKQDKLLPVIVSEKKPVAELRKTIEAAACSLEAAIFDKTECAACPHNSSLQTEMFGEAIATGNCTNRACYDGKLTSKLEGIAYGLKDEYPIVRIIRSGDNHTRIQLKVEGPTGVGEEQAKACHACQNFGAAVSGLPDSMGKVYGGQCFDTVCNQQKVAARIKAEKEAATPTTAKPAAGGKAAPAKKGDSSASAAEKPVTAISESDKVKTYRTSLWRKALRKEVAQNPDQANAYLLAVALNGLARNIAGDVMGKFFEKLTEQKSSSTLQGCLTAIHALDDQRRQQLTIGLTVAAIDGVEVSNLRELCRHHKLDLRPHWNLQNAQDFLEMLTKSEMKVLADEMGIRKALGDQFAKLFNKPKPEVIAGLLAVKNFDYSGKVPKVLHY